MDHFNWRGTELFAEDRTLRSIAEQYGTPTYVYAQATLQRHVRVLQQGLGALPHLICYALKANGNQALLELLLKLGCGFDAVSGGELCKAIEIDPGEMAALDGARYRHPFLAADKSGAGDQAWRLWFADYVTADAGTGLVHTAPGHGADDYKTGMAHQLPAYAPLDDAGRYVAGIAIDGLRTRA